jgi:putative ABC transport system substrate-binding protein
VNANIKRRAFITLVGGAAAAWTLAARAQQPSGVRRIGVLTNLPENDPDAQSRDAGFRQTLQQLGWTDGRNVRIDYRFALADAERTRKYAAELVALAPDVILAVGTEVTASLKRLTGTVPIVFVLVPDPVGAGLVNSLARPSGNVTGFTPYEYGVSAKWLELLKEIAPKVARVMVLRDAAVPEVGQFATIQAVARSFGVEVSPVGARDPGEIERGITAFSRNSNSGLIVPGSAFAAVHYNLIATLAARNKLPAIYFARMFVTAGGLISYGIDFVDQYRQAAGYVDRILKGANPGELPVQQATKFEMVINLKTAKALGLDVPDRLLALANEVID